MKTITILGYAFSLIKEDTKRAINILERASNDEGTSLWNVYGRNSEAKSDAMNECVNMELKLDGTNGHITSHNTFQFAYAFTFDYKGTNYTALITRDNNYLTATR